MTYTDTHKVAHKCDLCTDTKPVAKRVNMPYEYVTDAEKQNETWNIIILVYLWQSLFLYVNLNYIDTHNVALKCDLCKDTKPVMNK